MNSLLISENIYNRYQSLYEIKNYYGILAIYALILTAETKNDKILLKKCCRVLEDFPEKINHLQYKFPSYCIGGNAKAYAFMKGYLPEANNQVETYAIEIMNALRDKKGILCHPFFPEKQIIWIDVAMAATPFLLFSGLALNNNDFIDEAAKQTILMYEELLNKENRLLHQCKNIIAPNIISQDHWGRGNGWGYFALTELVKYLPNTSPYRNKAISYYKSLSEALLPYQSINGLWRQEIPLNNVMSYEESSATGLILYGMGTGIRMGFLTNESFIKAFENGIKGLAKQCIGKNFQTLLCCPGCLCPGEGEEKGTVNAYIAVLPKKDEPHSFAPIMLAMVEAYKCGIKDVEIEI